MSDPLIHAMVYLLAIFLITLAGIGFLGLVDKPDPRPKQPPAAE